MHEPVEGDTDTSIFLLGRAIFATAITALGVQCIIRGNAVPALEPVHAVASLQVIGWITGVVLVAAAVAILFRRTAIYGAAAIAVMFLLWLALLHAPALDAAPGNGGEWTGAAETFALGGAALVLLGLARRSFVERDISDLLATRFIVAGRIFFGISMIGFGALHFLYIAYVAFVIPNWIPAHVAFAYATGMAHVAAGISILTTVIARVAALLTAAMFGSWVLIVHLPRVAGKSHDPNEWTSMLIALAMCGAALLVAATFARRGVKGAPAGI